jgi:hypothetical protein
MSCSLFVRSRLRTHAALKSNQGNSADDNGSRERRQEGESQGQGES